MLSRYRTLFLSGSVLAGVLAISILTTAQTATKGPIARFTATTDNVATPGQTVRIELFAWSESTERDQFTKAWASPVQPAAPVVVAEAPAPAPAAQGAAGADPAAAARGGRGAARGRGGRGNRGAEAPPLPPIPVTPTSSLSAALQKAPSVGMLWTSETVGYAIRYAYRFPQADGSERIILATDRRLGAWNSFWKSAGTTAATAAPDYPFSVIELRLNANGLGEGKASLASLIAVDSSTQSIALENYSGLPVVLKGVKRQSGK